MDDSTTEAQRVSRLEELAERAEAKFMARYVVPGLTVLLLIVSGYAFKAIMNRLDTVDASNIAQEKNISVVQSDVRDINTRLDAGVIASITFNTKKNEEQDRALYDHDKRLQLVERNP